MKNPFVHPKLVKKTQELRPKLLESLKSRKRPITIKTWSRSSTIIPTMVRFIFGVHNGRDFVTFQVRERMVGHKLGEFSPTRTPRNRG